MSRIVLHEYSKFLIKPNSNYSIRSKISNIHIALVIQCQKRFDEKPREKLTNQSWLK